MKKRPLKFLSGLNFNNEYMSPLQIFFGQYSPSVETKTWFQ